jgi:hypothetical protein
MAQIKPKSVRPAAMINDSHGSHALTQMFESKPQMIQMSTDKAGKSVGPAAMINDSHESHELTQMFEAKPQMIQRSVFEICVISGRSKTHTRRFVISAIRGKE